MTAFPPSPSCAGSRRPNILRIQPGFTPDPTIGQSRQPICPHTASTPGRYISNRRLGNGPVQFPLWATIWGLPGQRRAHRALITGFVADWLLDHLRGPRSGNIPAGEAGAIKTSHAPNIVIFALAKLTHGIQGVCRAMMVRLAKPQPRHQVRTAPCPHAGRSAGVYPGPPTVRTMQRLPGPGLPGVSVPSPAG